MEIIKSTRHAKITGNFGGTLILYWLSKYGFECALVDHTGIDIIARNPHDQEVMGISVKSRSRTKGSEEGYVSIPNDNFAKAEAACSAFGCSPYFAIVVDADDTIYGFILSLRHLLKIFPKGKTRCGWKMTKPYLKIYKEDPKIKMFEFKTNTTKWWSANNSVQRTRSPLR